MTARPARDFPPRQQALDLLRRLAELYPAMADALPRARRPGAGRAGSAEPPAPLNLAASDWLAETEYLLARQVGRALLLLGWSVPWRSLHDPCPYCACWSLVHNTAKGLIACANWPDCADAQGRRHEWRGMEGWQRLGAMLQAADAEEGGEEG